MKIFITICVALLAMLFLNILQAEPAMDTVASFLVQEELMTAAHYCEFLNDVAAADPYQLYENAPEASIVRIGEPGSFTYAVLPGEKNVSMSSLDEIAVMRYCNWIQNGCSSREQDSTEYGMYQFQGDQVVQVSSQTSCFIAEQDDTKVIDRDIRSNRRDYLLTGGLVGEKSLRKSSKKEENAWKQNLLGKLLGAVVVSGSLFTCSACSMRREEDINEGNDRMIESDTVPQEFSGNPVTSSPQADKKQVTFGTQSVARIPPRGSQDLITVTEGEEIPRERDKAANVPPQSKTSKAVSRGQGGNRIQETTVQILENILPKKLWAKVRKAPITK